jgi:hypothetical protein
MKTVNKALNDRQLFKAGRGPVLEPVDIEFQATFETVFPGGGASLASGLRTENSDSIKSSCHT